MLPLEISPSYLKFTHQATDLPPGLKFALQTSNQPLMISQEFWKFNRVLQDIGPLGSLPKKEEMNSK